MKEANAKNTPLNQRLTLNDLSTALENFKLDNKYLFEPNNQLDRANISFFNRLINTLQDEIKNANSDMTLEEFFAKEINITIPPAININANILFCLSNEFGMRFLLDYPEYLSYLNSDSIHHSCKIDVNSKSYHYSPVAGFLAFEYSAALFIKSKHLASLINFSKISEMKTIHPSLLSDLEKVDSDTEILIASLIDSKHAKSSSFTGAILQNTAGKKILSKNSKLEDDFNDAIGLLFMGSALSETAVFTSMGLSSQGSIYKKNVVFQVEDTMRLHGQSSLSTDQTVIIEAKSDALMEEVDETTVKDEKPMTETADLTLDDQATTISHDEIETSQVKASIEESSQASNDPSAVVLNNTEDPEKFVLFAGISWYEMCLYEELHSKYVAAGYHENLAKLFALNNIRDQEHKSEEWRQTFNDYLMQEEILLQKLKLKALTQQLKLQIFGETISDLGSLTSLKVDNDTPSEHLVSEVVNQSITQKDTFKTTDLVSHSAQDIERSDSSRSIKPKSNFYHHRKQKKPGFFKSREQHNVNREAVSQLRSRRFGNHQADKE